MLLFDLQTGAFDPSEAQVRVFLTYGHHRYNDKNHDSDHDKCSFIKFHARHFDIFTVPLLSVDFGTPFKSLN